MRKKIITLIAFLSLISLSSNIYACNQDTTKFIVIEQIGNMDNFFVPIFIYPENQEFKVNEEFAYHFYISSVSFNAIRSYIINYNLEITDSMEALIPYSAWTFMISIFENKQKVYSYENPIASETKLFFKGLLDKLNNKDLNSLGLKKDIQNRILYNVDEYLKLKNNND